MAVRTIKGERVTVVGYIRRMPDGTYETYAVGESKLVGEEKATPRKRDYTIRETHNGSEKR